MKPYWTIAAVLVACGKSGGGGGGDDWSAKPLKSVVEKADDIAFSIDLPDGLVKDPTGSSNIGVMWEGKKGDRHDFGAPSVMVNKDAIPPSSVDEAVKDAMPSAKQDVVRKEAITGGFIVTLQGQNKKSIFVHVTKLDGTKALSCMASQAADDEPLPNLDATRAWLEKVCLSTTFKK